jgi:chromosome segregation ATPase
MGGIKPVPQPIGRKPDEIPAASAKLVTNPRRDDSRRAGRHGGSLSTPEISELERRISSAIDRIGAAVTGLSAGGGPDLAEALAAEREANAQLEARVAAIKERQETKVAGLEAEVRQLRAALLDRDGQLQRMREVNAGLRESNAALREANAAGLADAALVNSAMEAEVAALRETAEARRAEIDAVLARLEPLIEERDHA